MKELTVFLLAFALAFACSKDENEDESNPLVADFEVTVMGEAPNAELSINNLSEEANTYEWTFSEGANIETSTDEAPDNVTIDKAGEMIVTLTAKNNSEEQTMADTLSVTGHSAIKTYSDIRFDIDENGDNGRFFSFDTETMYRDGEINTDNSELIHIGFNYIAYSAIHFVSPDSDDITDVNIPNPLNTTIDNHQSNPAISHTEFENMADDRLLVDLSVASDNDVFGESTLPNISFFRLDDGRKGVINSKSIEDNQIVTDIIIQKY